MFARRRRVRQAVRPRFGRGFATGRSTSSRPTIPAFRHVLISSFWATSRRQISLPLSDSRGIAQGSPRERQGDSGSPSSDTTWSREPEGAGETLRDQSEDRGKVEEANLGGRPSNRAEEAAFHGAFVGGGDHRYIAACNGTASAGCPMSKATSRRRRRSKPGRSAFGHFLGPMAFMPSLHIDIAEVQTAEGKLRLFVAIDRTMPNCMRRPARWSRPNSCAT